MDTTEHAGPGGLLETPLWLLEELMAVGPRLVSRTRRQVEVLRRLGGNIPCVGGFIQPSETVRVPAHETPERLTVLDVLAAPEPGHAVPVDEMPAAVTAEPVDVSVATVGASGGVVPSANELPVTDYDSLAASQVVPRLATLSADELDQVGRYELAHRNRQTILHRVAQLRAQ